MKWLVAAGLVLACFVAGLMVGCERTKRQASVAYSRLAHQYDSAVVELVSARDVAAIVPVLQDSIRTYAGRIQYSTRIVIRRDTVRLIDTLAVDSLTDSVTFPPVTRDGITVLERLTFAPPIPPTRISRALGVAVQPDTLSLALLRMPDGLLRFIAAAERTGVRLQVVDAAGIQPPKASRFGVGCAGGPSLTVTLGGAAYGGLGVTCGVTVRW
jgi:hypothetical protein